MAQSTVGVGTRCIHILQHPEQPMEPPMASSNPHPRARTIVLYTKFNGKGIKMACNHAFGLRGPFVVAGLLSWQSTTGTRTGGMVTDATL